MVNPLLNIYNYLIDLLTTGRLLDTPEIAARRRRGFLARFRGGDDAAVIHPFGYNAQPDPHIQGQINSTSVKRRLANEMAVVPPQRFTSQDLQTPPPPAHQG